MKKTILILLAVIPFYCFSQNEKQTKEAIEVATAIVDAINGTNPAEDYIMINEYATKSPSIINKTTLAEYKTNGHFFLFFNGQKKSIFVCYINNGKVNRRPILLDQTCIDCKLDGSITYKELESKALVDNFYSSIKMTLTPFLATLIYNPDFINYMINNK